MTGERVKRRGYWTFFNFQGFGSEKTKGNNFSYIVGNPSVVNIAVSFSIDESQQSSENFPNGFHVPEQNYFLPPPNNSIPPRLFSINPDGSGV